MEDAQNLVPNPPVPSAASACSEDIVFQEFTWQEPKQWLQGGEPEGFGHGG